MAGRTSQGLSVQYGDGASPEVFTSLANITDHDGPNAENPDVDVTDLSSTAKEFLPGLTENGELSVNLNFDPTATSHLAAIADQEARTVRNWRIRWGMVSPARTWTFQAYVKSFQTRSQVDGPLTGALTLKISGAITRA